MWDYLDATGVLGRSSAIGWAKVDSLVVSKEDLAVAFVVIPKQKEAEAEAARTDLSD